MKSLSLSEVFYKVLLENELGGRKEKAYEFIDAVKGNSGLSFGVCQFDVGNNNEAVEILLKLGFSVEEIESLEKKEGYKSLSVRLMEQKALIDYYDKLECEKSVSWVEGLVKEFGFKLSNSEVILHLADYHNQFFMSRTGKLVRFLQEFNGVITPLVVLNFKLKNTKWGREHSEDVIRRFGNARRIWNKEVAKCPG